MIAWQLYGIGHGQESVTLIAYDAAGMGEAIGTLYEIAAGLTPLTPWTLPVEAPLAAATKAPAHAPAMKAAWEVALPDRAAAVRPLPDGKVVVLSQDGSLTALDPQGKEAWKAEMPGGETWLLDASADGGLIAVGASQRVVAFDARGKKLFETVVSDDKPPKPLTCVAVSPDGKQVAAGTTDGQLALLSPKGGLLSARGRAVWTIGGVPKGQLEKWQADHKKWEADMKAWEDAVKAWDAEHAPPKGGGQPVKPPKVKRPEKPAAAEPKKPVAEPYLAGLFSADGKTLVAATAKGADAISAADGKVIAAVGGVSGKAAPVRAGANTLMSDGNKTVALVSPAEGKLLGRLELPKGAEGVVALAATADGFLVGTESDGTVRKLKALEGKAEDQTAWAHQLDRRIPKKLAVAPDGLVAVAYWGGTLNVLDPTGAVKFAQALPQDIADLAWSDGKLVVGLADGRVMALEAR
jgi:outer membrane protein assembly factor BamB